VHVAKEETKFGFDMNELRSAATEIFWRRSFLMFQSLD